MKKIRHAKACKNRVLKAKQSVIGRRTFYQAGRIITVSTLIMRPTDSLDQWIQLYGTSSLGVYGTPHSHRHFHTSCLRKSYVTTERVNVTCLCSFTATYYYAYLFQTSALTDKHFCMVLGSGVLMWSPGAIFPFIYTQNLDLSRKFHQLPQEYRYTTRIDHYASDERNLQPVSAAAAGRRLLTSHGRVIAC